MTYTVLSGMLNPAHSLSHAKQFLDWLQEISDQKIIFFSVQPLKFRG